MLRAKVDRRDVKELADRAFARSANFFAEGEADKNVAGPYYPDDHNINDVFV